MRKTISGFTIVELLIVIVVIAILAAVTVVAYNGIQNRAYDTSVRSDLSQLAKALEIYKLNSPGSNYPIAGVNTQREELETINFKVNQAAYSTVANTNLTYMSSQNGTGYLLLATVKNGTVLYVKNGNNTVYTYDNSSTPFYPNGDAEQIFVKAMNNVTFTYNANTATYVGNGGGWRFWN